MRLFHRSIHHSLEPRSVQFPQVATLVATSVANAAASPSKSNVHPTHLTAPFATLSQTSAANHKVFFVASLICGTAFHILAQISAHMDRLVSFHAGSTTVPSSATYLPSTTFPINAWLSIEYWLVDELFRPGGEYRGRSDYESAVSVIRIPREPSRLKDPILDARNVSVVLFRFFRNGSESRKFISRFRFGKPRIVREAGEPL